MGGFLPGQLLDSRGQAFYPQQPGPRTLQDQPQSTEALMALELSLVGPQVAKQAH